MSAEIRAGLDPLTLCRVLRRPVPTPEQAAIIAAPLTSRQIVAAAGSGKTETMTLRVVWLVATGAVAPDRVCGLTFGRQAARNLASRMTAALRDWAAHQTGAASASGDGPTVSTYHAMAARLVRSHGMLVGVEPTVRLLDEAEAWQRAREVVDAYPGELPDLDIGPVAATRAVRALADAMAEQAVDASTLRAYAGDIVQSLESLPPGGRRRMLPPETSRLLRQAKIRRSLLPLVEAYTACKVRDNVVDFADQMAVATAVAQRFPQVRAEEASSWDLVLLDEYQDTSPIQVRLLQGLFSPAGDDLGTPVVAVGDPHQAIYAWRGAGSAMLDGMPQAFPLPDGSPAPGSSLSVAWRNDADILQTAEVVAAPLSPARLVVPTTRPVPRPDSPDGLVETARLATVDDEARFIAAWIAARRAAGQSDAAVLCRRREQMPRMVRALREQGVPVVSDASSTCRHAAHLTAFITHLADPRRGDALMALLTGPSVGATAGDLRALWAWAARPGSTRPSRRPRLADVVGDLPADQWCSPSGEGLSLDVKQRILALHRVVTAARGDAVHGPTHVVHRAVADWGWEGAVRASGASESCLGALDRMLCAAADYEQRAPGADLAGFVAWWEAAAETNGQRTVADRSAARGDAVAVMTVHAAKGLEWDVVAVPGLVEGVFPAVGSGRARWKDGRWVTSPPMERGWLSDAGLLPPLGGDGHESTLSSAHRLPTEDLPEICARATTAQDVEDALIASHHQMADAAVDDERRLMYVAVTRARHHLLLTAPVWSGGSAPRVTSRFVEELVSSGAPHRRGPWHAMPPDPQTWQALDVPLLEPAVDDCMAVEAPAEAAPVGDDDVAVVLSEATSSTTPGQVVMPSRSSAGDAAAAVLDPSRLAERLRRPLPTPPSRHRGDLARVRAALDSPAALPLLPDVERPADTVEVAAGSAWTPDFGAWACTVESTVPLAANLTVETVVGGLAVRCRIDAVYEVDGRHHLLEWCRGFSRGKEAAIRLSCARVAWARHRGVPLDSVTAARVDVFTGRTVRPRLWELPRLAEALWALAGDDDAGAASSGDSGHGHRRSDLSSLPKDPRPSARSVA